MISIDEAIIVKLKKSGKFFEILVDPDKALEFKKGKKIDIDGVLAYPGIYHDARKGNLVSEDELQKNFGTTDIFNVAKKIITEGNLQFTTEQRKKFLEEKTKEVANIISRMGINPQTNMPHPPQRILNAMEKAGVHIDPFLDAELQVNKTLEIIKPLLPIRFEKVTIQIVIPPQHTGKVYSMLKRSFEGFQEQWLSDGSLRVTINVPAGMKVELLKKVGDMTRGNFSSRIIERVGL